jgi:NAD(P)-dependent dehydrogenase (short-subunit alcohol dehydrogenase family)
MQGKIAVVTGASSGIGRRTAFDLAAEGALIVAAARREDRLQELVDELGGTSAGHSYHVTDVSRRSDAQALARHVAERHGRCDILVNNAGFSRHSPLGSPEAVSAVEQVMATNFFGTVYCTEALLPLLERAAPAHVINVASVAGRLSFGAVAPYVASKFAVVGWSESVANELRAKGIHMGLVEPGPIPTEGFPQKALVENRFLKHALADDAAVSAAIRSSIASGKLQRTVPRWYYLLQFFRLATPPLYRYVQTKVAAPRAPKGSNSKPPGTSY